MNKTQLKLDWCSWDAAKFACEQWHYSGCPPIAKCVKIGVWERSEFVGVVIYGPGATPEYGKRFQLKNTQVCELVRVALRFHQSPTSRIVAISMRKLKKLCPAMRLVISFADSSQGHHGGIYQAMNWVCAGESVTHSYRVCGKLEHPKTLHSRYGVGGQSVGWLRSHIDPNAERVIAAVKYRYLYPLDAAMKQQIEPLRQPYPKRATSIDSDAAGYQSDKGGATPTVALSGGAA